eukprot:CAMPEP_0116023080 /NCGR_PEP_ID=MMETSP0321-20121206/11375_1 /TAXON_ID=163516 /ORGANISM="Leptocylindrus danicus var. danicus, Strain B650" /LENGTH=78 /DNA_ID=CAMNT_0003494285 /DNA_START=375 /DNA_END=608 /DNA_ORIENTATION=-
MAVQHLLSKFDANDGRVDDECVLDFFGNAVFTKRIDDIHMYYVRARRLSFFYMIMICYLVGAYCGEEGFNFRMHAFNF